MMVAAHKHIHTYLHTHARNACTLILKTHTCNTHPARISCSDGYPCGRRALSRTSQLLPTSVAHITQPHRFTCLGTKLPLCTEHCLAANPLHFISGPSRQHGRQPFCLAERTGRDSTCRTSSSNRTMACLLRDMPAVRWPVQHAHHSQCCLARSGRDTPVECSWANWRHIRYLQQLTLMPPWRHAVLQTIQPKCCKGPTPNEIDSPPAHPAELDTPQTRNTAHDHKADTIDLPNTLACTGMAGTTERPCISCIAAGQPLTLPHPLSTQVQEQLAASSSKLLQAATTRGPQRRWVYDHGPSLPSLPAPLMNIPKSRDKAATVSRP